MKKKKIKKYKTLHLPKGMVEAIILYHQYRIEEFKNVQLDICFDILSNIIQKSVFNKNRDESKDLYAPMAATYLKSRYGNKYSIHKKFLINNCLIYHDLAYSGHASSFYIQDAVSYDRKIKSVIRDLSVYEKNDYYDYIPYCFLNGIEISLIDTINTGYTVNQKNRINSEWYKLRIEITKSNKSYFTRNYEDDSIYINNATPHIKKMGSHFRKNFQLDTEAALKHTEEQYKGELDQAENTIEERRAYNRYIARISSIRLIDKGKINKSLRFNRNDTNNRIDTNLTNMSGDLKQFIVDWDNMVYLDLKNSQPVIFNIILKDYYKTANSALKNEIDEYREATLKGKWYELLMEIFDEDREKCKENWMCIAYSKNTSFSQLKKRFESRFPEISKIIKKTKSQNYKDFAVKLQNKESEIIIDRICRKLVKEGIVPFTLHDAIIVKRSDQNKTLQIMEDVLLEYLGDIPKISVE